MNSLKNIACSNLADQILLVGKRIGNDDDAVAKVYDHFGDLPYSLAQDLWNDCLDKEDLQTAHVAILLHPNMTTLDLEEHTSPDHYFDLAKLIEWAGHKMKKLKSMRCPTALSLCEVNVARFHSCVPYLEELTISAGEIPQVWYKTLAKRFSSLKSLGLLNCRITDHGLLTLCANDSLLCKSLVSLNIANNYVSVVGCMMALERFSNLKEFVCDYNLTSLLTNHFEKQSYLNVSCPTYSLTGLSVFGKAKNHYYLPALATMCPLVSKLTLECRPSVFCCAQHSCPGESFSQFAHLTSLSFLFYDPVFSENDMIETLNCLVPALRSVSHQLRELTLNGLRQPRCATALNGVEPICWKRLTELCVSYLNCGLWPVLLTDCSCLEKLTVYTSSSFNNQSLCLLRSLPQLREIMLDEVSVTVDGLDSLFSSNKNIMGITTFRCENIGEATYHTRDS